MTQNLLSVMAPLARGSSSGVCLVTVPLLLFLSQPRMVPLALSIDKGRIKVKPQRRGRRGPRGCPRRTGASCRRQSA